ncbi:unnamed protein product, partial [Rotaria magnacalcarata]
SVTTKKVINPVNGVSSTVRNNQELHNRTVAPRSICQHPLPLSSTNATTVTLNGGSKTTVSTASTTKTPVILPSLRSTTETHRPIPAKRQSLVTATANPSSNPSTNVNNCTKEQYSSYIGQPSVATCCFFKRKAKQALQIASTTPKKS